MKSRAATGTASALLAAATDLPRHEAERLLVAATGMGRAVLAADPSLPADAAERFEALLRRRRGGEPLQYVEGTVQFGPIELRTDRRALIPRPETEQLWELVVGECDGVPEIVVDLCTGSGNLALACKHRWPGARVLATDASADALSLAVENGRFTGLAVEFLRGDLFDPLPAEIAGAVDIVVANPPYLADAEFASLPTEVRDHEPRAALVAGPDGDEVLGRIAAGCIRWLRPGGLIACEISEFHPERVQDRFSHLASSVRNDLAGRPRFVVAHLPE